MANAKVVQHKATSYDTTDDPQTSMPSAVLPKFSLKPKNEQSKFSKINSYRSVVTTAAIAITILLIVILLSCRVSACMHTSHACTIQQVLSCFGIL